MAEYFTDNKTPLARTLRTLKNSTAKVLADQFARPPPPATPDAVPELVLYQSYTSKVAPGKAWQLAVRGWLFCDGSASRKARLLLATTERLIRPGQANPQSETITEDTLVDLTGPSEIDTSACLDNELPSSSDSENDMEISVLRQRMTPVFRKGQPNVDLTIIVSAGYRSAEFAASTNASGRFDQVVHTNFEPEQVLVRTTYGAQAEATMVPFPVTAYGVSVISDIDDTVRHTGLIQGKRETLRNVLVNDYNQVRLDGVDEWYCQMARCGATFHYVSNSPWQLYDVVKGLLEAHNFPPGSIHLKYYQGFLEGMFEPVLSRKRDALTTLLLDFPYRKFILVGDSGELDLEAYTELAQRFPSQILAIYIRDVTLPPQESLSVYEPSQEEPLLNDKDLIDFGKPRPKVPPASTKPKLVLPAQIKPARAEQIHLPKQGVRDAISESFCATQGGVAGVVFSAGFPSRSSASELAHSVLNIPKTPPPLPPRRDNGKHETIIVNSAQDYSEHEQYDKRVEGWKMRVAYAQKVLPPQVKLRMWRKPQDVISESLRLINGGSKTDLLS